MRRFLHADPIGYRDGMNLYTYVRNNPLAFFDPDCLEIIVYSSDAFGIPGLNHAQVWSTILKKGKDTDESLWIYSGDGVGPLTCPYVVVHLPFGLSEGEFIKSIGKVNGWNNRVRIPYTNDSHSDLAIVFEQAEVPYPGAPNGRIDFDNDIKYIK